MIASLALSLALAPAPAPPVHHGTSAPADRERWILRHRPVRGLWELGAFAGVFVVAKPHDFYDVDLGYRRLRRAGPDAGLRAAYYPLSFLGLEGEFAGIWTAAQYGGQPAFLYGLRLSGIVQLPLSRVVPFAIGGYGLGGIRSPRDALGNDVDPIGHYGLGVKLFVTDWIALRVEGRHLLGPAAHQRRVVASHGEVLAGVSVTLGRGKLRRAAAPAAAAVAAPPPPRDTDGDGVQDVADRCPGFAGSATDGCAPPDADDDGIVDRFDSCPQVEGAGTDGCPVHATAEETEAGEPSKLP
ncbi:MAG: hypothetical protein K1X88_15310 [Nannocystaceae bacterium]|nr:hypothetical protein [Nannocystaceae bacterium]